MNSPLVSLSLFFFPPFAEWEKEEEEKEFSNIHLKPAAAANGWVGPVCFP